MKKILKLILGMVFLVGLAATLNANPIKTVVVDNVEEAPCSTVFTVCDNHAPDDYEHFASCMDSNGCG